MKRRWADLPLRGKALVVISLPLVVLLLSLVLIYTTERQTARAEEDVRRVLRVQGEDLTIANAELVEPTAPVSSAGLWVHVQELGGRGDSQPSS